MRSTKNLYKGLIWIWKKFLVDVIKILLLICKRTFCNLLEKNGCSRCDNAKQTPVSAEKPGGLENKQLIAFFNFAF